MDDGKNVFLCQNEKDGIKAEDMLEYKYSWHVQYGTSNESMLSEENVTDFQFITEEELNADVTPSPSLDGKEIEVKIDGVSYTATLKLKS